MLLSHMGIAVVCSLKGLQAEPTNVRSTHASNVVAAIRLFNEGLAFRAVSDVIVQLELLKRRYSASDYVLIVGTGHVAVLCMASGTDRR